MRADIAKNDCRSLCLQHSSSIELCDYPSAALTWSFVHKAQRKTTALGFRIDIICNMNVFCSLAAILIVIKVVAYCYEEI